MTSEPKETKPIPSYVSKDFEVANPGDYDSWAHAYLVHMHHLDPHGILVFADCEQDAIDEVADYGEEQGYLGWFIDDSEMADYTQVTDGEERWADEVMLVGNHGLPIDGSEIYVTELDGKAMALARIYAYAAAERAELSEGPQGELDELIVTLRAFLWPR